MMVYAPPSQQPQLDRPLETLGDEEKEIYKFFISQENVDKLMSFLSLEENKERDSFNTRRFWMFKVMLIPSVFLFHSSIPLE